MVNKSRGRPRGDSDARQRILDAARERFVSGGYASTSLRAIARDAAVDHALVSYYFGSKEGLFRAVTELVLTPGQVLDAVKLRAPTERLGRELLEVALTAWDHPQYQSQLSSLLREALTIPDTVHLVGGFLETEAVGRLAAYLGGDARATRRASAAASLIAGIYFTRYLLKIEPIASMPREQVVAQHAPALQHILTASTGSPARPSRPATPRVPRAAE